MKSFFTHTLYYTLLYKHIGVPGSVRSMVGKLCEMGWLFRRITTFVKLNGGGMQHGSNTLSLVGQSLSYAIQEEMSDYYRLVAVLEAQMNEKDEKDEKEEGK